MSRRTIAKHANGSTVVKSLILATSILGIGVGLKACIRTKNDEQERIDRKIGVKEPLHFHIGEESWDFGWSKVDENDKLISVTALERSSKFWITILSLFPISIEETWPDYDKNTGYATFSMTTHFAKLVARTVCEFTRELVYSEINDPEAIAKLLNGDKSVQGTAIYSKEELDKRFKMSGLYEQVVFMIFMVADGFFVYKQDCMLRFGGAGIGWFSVDYSLVNPIKVIIVNTQPEIVKILSNLQAGRVSLLTICECEADIRTADEILIKGTKWAVNKFLTWKTSRCKSLWSFPDVTDSTRSKQASATDLTGDTTADLTKDSIEYQRIDQLERVSESSLHLNAMDQDSASSNHSGQLSSDNSAIQSQKIKLILTKLGSDMFFVRTLGKFLMLYSDLLLEYDNCVKSPVEGAWDLLLNMTIRNCNRYNPLLRYSYGVNVISKPIWGQLRNQLSLHDRYAYESPDELGQMEIFRDDSLLYFGIFFSERGLVLMDSLGYMRYTSNGSQVEESLSPDFKFSRYLIVMVDSAVRAMLTLLSHDILDPEKEKCSRWEEAIDSLNIHAINERERLASINTAWKSTANMAFEFY